MQEVTTESYSASPHTNKFNSNFWSYPLYNITKL